jgi:hypothetical protein
MTFNKKSLIVPSDRKIFDRLANALGLEADTLSHFLMMEFLEKTLHLMFSYGKIGKTFRMR